MPTVRDSVVVDGAEKSVCHVQVPLLGSGKDSKGRLLSALLLRIIGCVLLGEDLVLLLGVSSVADADVPPEDVWLVHLRISQEKAPDMIPIAFILEHKFVPGRINVQSKLFTDSSNLIDE